MGEDEWFTIEPCVSDQGKPAWKIYRHFRYQRTPLYVPLFGSRSGGYTEGKYLQCYVDTPEEAMPIIDHLKKSKIMVT